MYVNDAAGASSGGVAIFMSPPTVDSLKNQQQELRDKVLALQNGADEDERDFTDEEATQISGLLDQIQNLEGRIQLRQRLAPTPGSNRKSTAEVVDAGPQRSSAPAQPRSGPQGMWGWRNSGEFAIAVRAASMGGAPDSRLLNAAASTYSSEGVGADGGFAVPPDIRADIIQKVTGEASLLPLTDTIPTSSNSVTFPVDTTAPWDTSGGIQAYWVAEGATKTQSKVSLEQVSTRAQTIAALIPVTEELLEDAPALDAFIRRKAPEKMEFKISNAIVRGSGSGTPLGFMNSASLITVAAEGAQTADTVNATNVAKMYAAMPAGSISTARWLVHPTVMAQFPLMVIGQQPVYLPPNGLAGAPGGMLFGRPVIPTQTAAIVGDLGDIMFVDLQQYMSIVKTGNGRDANSLRTDVSIHLWFDQDLVAFRFTMRVGGQPWWNAPITGRDGSSQQSPFVVLAAR